MATWRRITGVVGLAAGAVAAGAGVVVAAERIAIGRTQVLRAVAAPEGLGQLRGQPLTVLADDGVPLHVEIDEPPAAGRRPRRGDLPPLTIIFCHGYTLNQDCWHFQRAPCASTAWYSGTSGIMAGPGGPPRAWPASTGSGPTWT